jgi:hypothetical protein
MSYWISYKINLLVSSVSGGGDVHEPMNNTHEPDPAMTLIHTLLLVPFFLLLYLLFFVFIEFKQCCSHNSSTHDILTTRYVPYTIKGGR